MPELSDEQLVRQAQNGNVAAVGELYDRHHMRIFRFVRSKVYHTQLAQDLTGEIFLRMVSALPGYRPQGVPFTAWLYRIARNHVINHGQKEQHRKQLPLTYANHIPHPNNNPATIVEQQLALERVLAGLAQLDEDQREVLTLRLIAGLSLKEVADALDKTVAAVKTLQYRGTRALRLAVRLS